MLSISRHSRLAAALLAAIVLAACGGAEERKAKYLERGIAYFDEDNTEKALVEFKNVLQIDPNAAEPYYYLGRIAERDKDWRKAFGYYGKAVELDPELLPARVSLGRFYLLAGDNDKAEEQVGEVLARDPGHSGALTLRASILYRGEQPAEAIAVLQEVLSREPGNEEAATLLAGIYDRQDRADAALQVLDQAGSVNPDSTMLRMKLIKAYLARQENDKAIDLVNGLVKDFPDNVDYRVMLASFYAQIDENEKAEAVLRESIARDPDDAGRYLTLIDYFKKKSGIDRAVTELEKMSAENQDIVDLQFALASLYAEAGDPDRTESVYRALIDRYGTDPEGLKARTALALLRVKSGNNAAATALLEEVLAENPQDSGALLLKGRLQLANKEYPDAIASFRSVLRDQPDSAEVMQLLAAAHDANGEKDLALEILMRAVEAQPANTTVRLALARYQLTGGDYSSALMNVNALLVLERDSVPGLQAKAEILAKQGDSEALEAVLSRLEEVSPDTGLGPYGKGRLYRSQKKYAEAVAEFEKALQREPDSFLALMELVNAEIESGSPESAIARLQSILEASPGHRSANYLLGEAYMAAGDFANAEQAFLRQLEHDRNNAVVYRSLATSRFRQGNGDGAIQILRQGLEALPGDSVLVLHLAMVQDDLGKLDAAIETYRQGMELQPGNVRFKVGLAGIYEQQGRHDEAITLYEQALELNPDALVAVNNLAVLLSEHRSDEQSMNRALQLAQRLADSKRPALQDTLGWIHYLRGEYDKAAEVLAAVVEQAPGEGVFGYHLGMTYYRQGDLRAARRILSQAVAEDQDYKGIEEARRVYAEIGGSQAD